VARRAQGGFHMHVVFHDPYLDDSMPLEELLAVSDVVSLHCSANAETEGLIGAAQLAAMKPTAYLINTASGRVIDEAALVECLGRGGIAGAALDVFAEEPLPAESLLRHLDNVVLTPHLAGAADVLRHRAAVICDDIERIRRGQPPHHCANPEVLPPPRATSPW
jgi:D-3-phosphoglycerate dehydrogenase